MPYELTEIVAACTNTTRVQARQGLSTEGGRRHGVFIFNTLWQLEKTTLSNGLSLGISATLQGGPHAQEYLASTQQTPWFFILVWFGFSVLLVS